MFCFCKFWNIIPQQNRMVLVEERLPHRRFIESQTDFISEIGFLYG
ncbi:hypothetical protein CHCC20335_2413 [Bacillus paralicheniformis]|nr:hypothetical protein CHCC20335_2413 [Bacillus paralicheniformis]